jgi:hypothetical protein
MMASADYFGFKSLKVRLSVVFGHLECEALSNLCSDSCNDGIRQSRILWEYLNVSLHQTKAIPAHYTAGMVNIVASASMKAFMHDVMAIEGEANGKFGS